MTLIAIGLLGLCFGSFVNALVWRIHEQGKSAKKRKLKVKNEDLSISKGRSMCVHCGHALRTADLIPVFSWLALRGRCRYCKKRISAQYPLVELVSAALFIISYLYWPEPLEGLQAAAFGLWLVLLTGLLALVVYDFRWMILPNRIIFPMYGVAAVFALVLLIDSANSPAETAVALLGGLAVGGGFFYALFQISDGKWIGGGDVKLGFLLGLILAHPVAAAVMLFGASLLGVLYVIPLMFLQKVSRSSRIPFGPFLIAAAVLVMLFGSDLVDWYSGFLFDV